MEVNSLDHIQNRIHDPKSFLTTDPKRVNTASGSSKQFYYMQQFYYTAHIFTDIFQLEA